MKRRQGTRRTGHGILLVLFGALTVCTAARGRADEETITLDHLRDHVTLSASDRMRGEFVSWFNPAGSPSNNNYNFFANRARAGISLAYPTVEFVAEAQDVRLVDLPGADSKNSAQGTFGPGAAYYDHTRTRDQGELTLRRGYVALRKFGLPGVSGKAGRFDYKHGEEKLAQDPALLWLQKARIGQRLVGTFEYTHVGRTFDGIQAAYDQGPLNLTGIVTHPTAGGFNVNANKEIQKIDLIGATATVVEPEGVSPMSAQLFYLFYQDRRNLVATDSRIKEASTCGPGDHRRYRNCDRRRISISTIGGDIVQVIPAGPGKVDVLGWAAYQVGDWQSLVHTGWAYAVETGYQLPDVYAKPWLRVGFNRTSGDKSPFDGHHGTFLQLLPTARAYAAFPFYNLMNSQDLFLQGIIKPCKGVTMAMTAHHLRATESADLWYAGGGASSKSIFGFSGIKTQGRHELAYLTDVDISYELDKSWTRDLTVTVSGYYGHAFGQGVVSANYAANDADYGFVETTIKY